MKIKNLIVLGGIFAAVIFVVMATGGCDRTPSSDQKEQAAQEVVQGNIFAQTGTPAITHAHERKLLKMLYELRDREDLKTYAYLQDYNGKLRFFGTCLGFGIPYSTQYSNPQKVELWYEHWYILPQAEPNGLFVPPSAEGTWLMMLDPSDETAKVVYAEPRVVVSQFKFIGSIVE